MRRFIKQIVAFFIVTLIPYFVIPTMALLYNNRYKKIVAPSVVYYSIEKSKKKSGSTILIIGDSVGQQLFNNQEYNDSINSIACNQGISMLGQYLLLKNYINAGNNPKKIYIVYTLRGFKNNLQQIFTYNYFLKPFYKQEYKPYFSSIVNSQIKKIPYYQFSQLPNILTTNWSPNFKTKDKQEYEFLSPITVQYLKKIHRLVKDNNIQLSMIPPPTTLKNKEKVINFLQEEIQKNELEQVFNGYIEKIIYLDEDYFFDGIHLKKPLKYTRLFEQKYITY